MLLIEQIHRIPLNNLEVAMPALPWTKGSEQYWWLGSSQPVLGSVKHTLCWDTCLASKLLVHGLVIGFGIDYVKKE